MKNYNNSIQAGILIAQKLQEWRFMLIPPGKTHKQLRCWLKAKGIQNELWEKVVKNTSNDHVTNNRNKYRNFHEYYPFILL